MKFFILVFIISSFFISCKNSNGKTLSFRHEESVNGYYAAQDFNSLEPVWFYKTGAAIRSTPLLDNNKLYLGSCDSNFYVINAVNGKEIWRFKAAAAISSSAALSNGILYFQDRSNTLYALDENNGKEKWHFNMGASLRYDWGFDYYQSSPLVVDNSLYIGSGDGNLYSINPDNGKIKWKYNCGAMLRSSPAFAKGQVFVGDCSGKLYAIDATNGTKTWQFNTIGDTLNNEMEGFDRKAIIASPVIKDDIIITGSRDGYLYANDVKTGKEKWRYNYEVSWVITTVAIKDSVIIAGTSDGQFVNALNLFTGREIWKKSTSLVWSSPLIVGNTVLTAQNDGFIYLHDLLTGNQKCKLRVGDRFFSSPVYHDGKFFVGNDDGSLYAFITKSVNPVSASKAVFWNKDFSTRKSGLDSYLKDYFVAEGYQLLDEGKLDTFLIDHIRDKKSSVVVLATNYFPEKTVAGAGDSSLIYQYLHAGGKIVTTGLNPAAFSMDYQNKKIQGLDYSLAKAITGIEYPYKDLRSHKGFYSSSPTTEGLKWGLTKAGIGHSAISSSMATPLSVDENGNAAYWVKNYGFKEGTGLVQFWMTPDRLDLITDLKRVAEFGLK